MILFHSNLSRQVGLGTTEEKVLELVLRHQPVLVGELAAHAGMVKNSLSDTLDRLEQKSFIERQPHPSDRRKVFIVSTTSGVARIGALFAGLVAGLNELSADFTTEHLAVIAEYQHRAAELQLAEAQSLTQHVDDGQGINGDAFPPRPR